MRERINFRFAVVLLVTLTLTIAGGWLLHRWQQRRQVGGLLDLAQQAESQRQYGRARWLLETYLAANPTDTAARAHYGQVCEPLARNAPGRRAVIDVYQQVIDEDPGRADVRIRLAKLYGQNSQYKEAKLQLQAINAATSDDHDLVYLLGVCHDVAGEERDAEKMYRRAIELDPKQLGYYLRLAELLRRASPTRERDLEADDLVNAMVAANPSVSAAYLNRARYKLVFHLTDATEEKKRKAAIQLLVGADVSEAVKLDPGDVDARLAAADVTVDREEGRNHLRTALERHPSDERACLALAALEWADKRNDEAIAVLRRGIARRPGNPSLLSELANCLLATQKLDEVDRVVREMERWKAVPDQVSLIKARRQMAKGNWTLAREMLEAARPSLMSSVLKAAEADTLLGQCFESLSNSDQALVAYRRAATDLATRTDGRNASAPLIQLARTSVARVLASLGRTDEAVDELRGPATAAEAPPEAVALFARYRTKQYLAESRQTRQIATILKEFDNLKSHHPKLSELVLLQAEVLAADKDPSRLDQAEKFLRQALAQEPNATALGVPLARLLYYRRQQPAAATQVLDELEQKSGPTVDIDLARLEMLGRLDDQKAPSVTRSAAEHFRSFKSVDERVSLATGLAEYHTRRKEYSDAAKWWEEVAGLRPLDVSVRFRQFELAALSGVSEGMEKAVRDIRSIDGAGGAFGLFAEALLIVSREKRPTAADLQEARRHLAAAARQRPQWAVVPALAGSVAAREGKLDEAISELSRAIDLGDRRPQTVSLTAQLLMKRKRVEEANQLLRRFRPEGQGSPSTELTRLAAEASLASRDVDRAVSLAAVAVTPASEKADEHLWQAEIFWQAGKADEAQKAIKNAIQADDASGTAWVALVRHHVRTGNREFAERVVKDLDRNLQGKADRLISLAQCHDLLGSREQAEKAYAEAVAGRPGDVPTVRLAAGYYLRIGTPQRAVPLLRGLVDGSGPLTEADRTWARRSLALALATTGDYQNNKRALEILDGLLAANGEDYETLLIKARVWAQRPQHRRDAVTLLQSARTRQLLGPDGEYLLGQLLADTGSWAEGRRLLSNALGREPDNVQYLAYYVDRLIREGEFAEVKVWLDRLDRLTSGDLTAVRLRVLSLILDDRIDNGAVEAAATLRKAAQSPLPKDGDRRSRLVALARLAEEGGLRSKVGQSQMFQLAEEFLRTAVESGKANDKLALAGYLGRRGKWKECLDLIREIGPGVEPIAIAGALVNIAYSPTLIPESQLEGIEKELVGQVKRANPAPAVAANLLGAFHARRGRYKEAAAEFRRALASDSNNSLLMNNLAYMLILSQGPQGEAGELVARASELSGWTAQLLDTRGMGHVAAGRATEAVQDLESAVSHQASASRCLHLAASYLAAGRKGDAMKQLNRVDRLRHDGSLVLPAERDLEARVAGEIATR